MLNAQREAARPEFTHSMTKGSFLEQGYCWGLPGATGSHTQRSDIFPRVDSKMWFKLQEVYAFLLLNSKKRGCLSSAYCCCKETQ